MNSRAIVTLAIGADYVASWKHHCGANWRQYAERHGFDLICLEQPLDTSERAQRRSPAWQKCLVLGQPFASAYEQIVWMDSDILVNAHAAPDVAAGVPREKVGAAEEMVYSHNDPIGGQACLQRAYDFWPGAIHNFTPREYYTNYGLPGDCDQVLNTGVLVLSPAHHRALLEHVYFDYEEKGGREWHMEMRPLSYELVKAGVVHLLDPRFNLMWPFHRFLHYPYLLEKPTPPGRRARLRRQLKHLRRGRLIRHLHAAAVNATFQLSFFMHFGGMDTQEMDLVNSRATSWLDFLT